MFAARPTAIVAAIALAAASLAAQAPAPGPIVVDLSVTRAGQPVTGLTAADITLKDSGVAQSVEVIAAGTQPLDVVLVLDSSASIRGDALEQLKAAARAAFGALRADDQAALLTFSQNVTLRTALTADRARLDAAAAGIAGGGSTSLADAAFAALTMKRRAPRTLVLVFTDGDDVASWLPPSEVVQAAQRIGAVVSGVMMAVPGHTGASIAKAYAARDKGGADARSQITKWLWDAPAIYRSALLPVLALETGGEAVPVADATKLSAVFVDLITRHAQRYVVRYTPKDVLASGWHPIEIAVRGGGEITARTGYLN